MDVNRIQQQRIEQMIRSLSSSCLSVSNINRNYIQSSSAAVVNSHVRESAIKNPLPIGNTSLNHHLDKSALLKPVDSIPTNELTRNPLISQLSNLFTEDYITSVVPILHNRTIEYKKVEAKYFLDQGFLAEEKQFAFSGLYMTKEFIQVLDLAKNDTTVINLGTGDGKSFTARKLIEFYAENDYVVIVASPYILLTTENYEKLKGKINENITIVNYTNLKPENLELYVKANIHCITINSLMGNPGETIKNQSKVKEKYLDDLLNYCQDNNKEVIIFLDEIHAGIMNFKPSLLKNLNKWTKLVRKIFVISATFSEASNIVLQYLAQLTDKKLTIYNCDRRKFSAVQANLHLNITERPYSSKDISPLFYIKKIVENALLSKQKVNILVATKSLVSALTNPKSHEPLAQFLCEMKPNIIIGVDIRSKKNIFSPSKINIGTTFNTGISIDESNSTFILITPVFFGPDSQKLAGIFMEGSPAILQAMARLRNGGNIHVFMNKPTHLIEGSYRETIPTFLKGLQLASYFDCNHQKEILDNAYKGNKLHLRNLAKRGHINEDKLAYTSRDTFILFRSQYELSSNYEIFGKKVNPYIIWAAYHDQFTNCTLKTINLIAEPTKKVEIQEETIIPDLKKFLRANIEEKISALSDKEALNLMYNQIHIHKENGVYDPQRKEIIYKGKPVDYEHSKYHPAITKALINILFEFRTNTKFNYDTSNYILGNILLARCYKLSDKLDKRNNLKIAYSILEDVKRCLSEYVVFDFPLAQQAITESMEKDICMALYELRENDFFIHNKLFSFLQTYSFTFQSDGSIHFQNTDINKRRFVLLKALTNIFYESKSIMRKTDGKTYRERIILAEKPIPEYRLDLTFDLTPDNFVGLITGS